MGIAFPAHRRGFNHRNEVHLGSKLRSQVYPHFPAPRQELSPLLCYLGAHTDVANIHLGKTAEMLPSGTISTS